MSSRMEVLYSQAATHLDESKLHIQSHVSLIMQSLNAAVSKMQQNQYDHSQISQH